jgi:hypothetical protein
MIPTKPILRIPIPSGLKIATRMRLSDAIHVQITRRRHRKVSRFEREIGMTERLLTKVIQAVLMVRESVTIIIIIIVASIGDGELCVKIDETMLLVIERDGERSILMSVIEAPRAVESESSLIPPLVRRSRSSHDEMHALFHLHFYFPLQL